MASPGAPIGSGAASLSSSSVSSRTCNGHDNEGIAIFSCDSTPEAETAAGGQRAPGSIGAQGCRRASTKRGRVLGARADRNRGGRRVAGDGTPMSEREAFDAILASLHETALDVRPPRRTTSCWPARWVRPWRRCSTPPGWALCSSTGAGGSWRRTTAPGMCYGPARVCSTSTVSSAPRLRKDDAKLQAVLARALPPFGVQGAAGSTMVTRPSPLPPLALHVNPVVRAESTIRTHVKHMFAKHGLSRSGGPGATLYFRWAALRNPGTEGGSGCGSALTSSALQ